jgi:hypothetical protein
MENEPAQNTNTEVWREIPGDYYSSSIHVTDQNDIGINCGGHVIVAPVKTWHNLGEKFLCVNLSLPEWRRKLAMWLLNVPSRKV